MLQSCQEQWMIEMDAERYSRNPLLSVSFDDDFIILYIYVCGVKVKSATVVEANPNGPFSLATTPRCRGVLSKEASSTIFSLRYDKTWNWTPVFQAISEHSTHKGNEPVDIYVSYVKVKLATVVKGNQKAPFSIATTPRCGRALLLSLDCWVLSKEVSSSIFKVFGMTRSGIEPRPPGPLANTLGKGEALFLHLGSSYWKRSFN